MTNQIQQEQPDEYAERIEHLRKLIADSEALAARLETEVDLCPGPEGGYYEAALIRSRIELRTACDHMRDEIAAIEKYGKEEADQ